MEHVTVCMKGFDTNLLENIWRWDELVADILLDNEPNTQDLWASNKVLQENGKIS